MSAVRLHGKNMSSFMVVPGKRVFDLSPVLPKSYIDVSWNDLKNKIVQNENIILAKYGDIHPYENGPVFECKTLFLHMCDKNFISYWLNNHTFPKLQKVYIGSHPCDSYTLIRYRENKNGEYSKFSCFEEIYLHEKFEYYKNKWWTDIDNIKIITNSDYHKELESYDSEKLILKEY